MAGMLILDRMPGKPAILFSVDEGTDLDRVFERSLQQARKELQVRLRVLQGRWMGVWGRGLFY